MKFVLVLVLALVPFCGLADSPPNPPSEAPKLRDVKVKMRLMKQTIKKNPDGGIVVGHEDVCTGEFTTGLYDNRADGSISFGAGVDCDSKVKDAPVRVNVNGFMGLYRFGVDKSSEKEMKGANLFVTVYSKGDARDLVLPSQNAFAGVPDLKAKSLIIFAEHTYWAGEKDWVNDEQFSAVAEFLDDQQ